MTRASRATIGLRIIGRRLPGLRWASYDSVHLAVQRQRPTEVVGLVPGDAHEATFDLTLDVVTDERGLDLRGPFVHGRRGERFVYLTWGQVRPDGAFEMFRRAKLQLSALAERDVAEAVDAGAGLEAVLDLTDERGGPLSAAVRPPRVQWRTSPRPAVKPGMSISQPGSAGEVAAEPMVEETMVVDGSSYRVSWFDPPFRPPLEATTQALGICFTPTSRIVLVTWNGTDWTLPGGTIEPGETLEQTLAREVREEACARVLACAYIGCQRVEPLDGAPIPYYQTRFWARVELEAFDPKDEMIARELVLPGEFLGRLSWGHAATAALILERGLRIQRGETDPAAVPGSRGDTEK